MEKDYLLLYLFDRGGAESGALLTVRDVPFSEVPEALLCLGEKIEVAMKENSVTKAKIAFGRGYPEYQVMLDLPPAPSDGASRERVIRAALLCVSNFVIKIRNAIEKS